MIAYHVTVAAPDTHQAHVRVEVSDAPESFRFSIPAWTPGSYLLREFARYLGEPSVSAGGRSVGCAKVAKGTWEISGGGGTVSIEYDLYGHELTVRTPHIDGSHAYFLGSNAFVYVHGRESKPHTARVTAPDGWELYCALPQKDGEFHAPDYDVLADTPFEAGPDHLVHTFEALGVPHRFVFWGADPVRIDLDKLEADTRALIETNARTFDGNLPYENYDFVFHISATARGGLEHLNSTVLATPWRYFDSDEGYLEMLELISHEHFHVWNVKRIRPAALGPFDYQNENHTTALWVVEGFTSYFDALNCLRAKVVDAEHYLKRLADDLTRFRNTPGRHQQSVAQASWDAWIRLYRADENTPNRTVSYYLKGALVSLTLDLEIRKSTDGRCSLRDVMALLWSDFLETGAGYPDNSIPDAIHRATGVDASELVARLIHETGDPDFGALLESHGVDFSTEGEDSAWLGLDLEARADGVRVKHVRADGPAHGCGVYPNDLIVAIEGRRLNSSSLAASQKLLRSERPVQLHVFRRDQLLVESLTPAASPKHKVTLQTVQDPTDAQRARWTEWTGTAWPETKRDD